MSDWESVSDFDGSNNNVYMFAHKTPLLSMDGIGGLEASNEIWISTSETSTNWEFNFISHCNKFIRIINKFVFILESYLSRVVFEFLESVKRC